MGFEADDDEESDQAHENRIKRCRSCNAQIIWFKTAQGRNMPVDADTVEKGQFELDLTVHKSHFATCKHAAIHRNPRK